MNGSWDPLFLNINRKRNIGIHFKNIECRKNSMCKFTITGFSCVNSEFPNLFCKFRVMRFFCVKSEFLDFLCKFRVPRFFLSTWKTKFVQVLMLRRSSKSKFMPSAYVFPGGVLSKEDLSQVIALIYYWLIETNCM